MTTLLSILQGILLEEPGPLALAMILAAVVLAVSGVNRRHKGLVITSGLLVCMSVGIFVLAAMVTTQREEISAATVQLLRATGDPVNMAGIRDKIAPDARLLGPDGSVWVDVDQLMPQIEKALTRWPIQRHNVRETYIRVTHDQGKELARAEIQLSTRTVHTPALDIGHATRWALYWQRDPQGFWKVHDIQWLAWMNNPPSKGLLQQ